MSVQGFNLPPTGSEGHTVLQTGSIHVAILTSCQILCNSAFQKPLSCIYLGGKNKKHLRGSTQAIICPLDIILTMTHRAVVSIMALGRNLALILPPLWFFYQYNHRNTLPGGYIFTIPSYSLNLYFCICLHRLLSQSQGEQRDRQECHHGKIPGANSVEGVGMFVKVFI